MATAVGLAGLVFCRFLPVVLAATFGAKFFAEALGIFFALFQSHFANRAFFLEEI